MIGRSQMKMFLVSAAAWSETMNRCEYRVGLQKHTGEVLIFA